MAISFPKAGIHWKLISTISGRDSVTYEYEAPISDSIKKYHLSKVVTPDGEYRTYSVG